MERKVNNSDWDRFIHIVFFPWWRCLPPSINVLILPCQEDIFIWPPFFQYHRRLLRQKAGGACLHMPKSGYLPASFEVIPLQKVALPRPRRWKFKFPSMPKNIVTLTLTALKFQSAKLAFFSAGAKKSSLQSRLSWQQTIFYPTEIRSRPIDCDPRYGKNKMFFSVIFTHS